MAVFGVVQAFSLANLHSLLGVLLAPFALLSLYLVVNEIVRYRTRFCDFGGPANRPLVGNLPDITINAPERFRRWAEKHGDVFQVQLGNIPILVVNSAAAAKELFGHHSHALSSRPTFYTFHKIVAKTAGATIGTSPISDSLKRRRRAAASALNRPAVASYAPHLDLETFALVQDLFQAGSAGKTAINPMPSIQRFALSMALTVNWGTRIASRDSALFREIIEVERGIVSTRNRTDNMMDYIPLMRLNPFSARKIKAREWQERRDVYNAKFMHDLEQQVEDGTHQPSIQSSAMLDPDTKLSKAELMSISISIIQGGTDTVGGTVNWSLAYLSQQPEIQEKALAEIRQHYTMEDVLSASVASEENCPYLTALVRECLRYFTVLRLSLPRATISDITYQGKHIPTGSTIWLNAWACNMDPIIHKDPFVFRPERWIEQPELPLFTYGLGYRMCVGSTLANRELYLLLLRVFSCFKIVPGDGMQKIDHVSGSENVGEGGRSPRQYEVYFKPRDNGLNEALNEREKDLGL